MYSAISSCSAECVSCVLLAEWPRSLMLCLSPVKSYMLLETVVYFEFCTSVPMSVFKRLCLYSFFINCTELSSLQELFLQLQPHRAVRQHRSGELRVRRAVTYGQSFPIGLATTTNYTPIYDLTCYTELCRLLVLRLCAIGVDLCN